MTDCLICDKPIVEGYCDACHHGSFGRAHEALLAGGVVVLQTHLDRLMNISEVAIDDLNDPEGERWIKEMKELYGT